MPKKTATIVFVSNNALAGRIDPADNFGVFFSRHPGLAE